jgi:hypothetical protein
VDPPGSGESDNPEAAFNTATLEFLLRNRG